LGHTILSIFSRNKLSQSENKVNFHPISELVNLRRLYGDKVIAKVKVDDAIFGMRGLPVLFYDNSRLDDIKGITFRGHSISEFCQKAQKAHGGTEPLPEAMFFLLATGRYPTTAEFNSLVVNWQHRAILSASDIAFITSLPRGFHPMTMLSMVLMQLQVQSKFFKAYQRGVHKSRYW